VPRSQLVSSSFAFGSAFDWQERLSAALKLSRKDGAVDDIRSDSEDEDQDEQLNRRIARKKGQ
jgi:hypothetical protein